MSAHNRLPCGCWCGPWFSVSPPPRCVLHSERRVDPNASSMIATATTIAAPIAAPQPPDPSPFKLSLLIEHVDRKMRELAGAAFTEGEVAAFDRWQLALEELRLLRERIEAAEAAYQAPSPTQQKAAR